MKRNTFQPFFYLFFDSKCTAKQTKTDTLQVVITSSRIDLPFKENSRTIQLITAEDIKKSGDKCCRCFAANCSIDVRRRGTSGTQADLYIRGGSFDQTLLLVDGFKLDDVQTGHHSMNALPLKL
jgi:iron complex outermembrane receptor protein